MSFKLDCISGGQPKIVDGIPRIPEGYCKLFYRVTEKQLPELGARAVYRVDGLLLVYLTENEFRQFQEAIDALDKLKEDYQQLERRAQTLGTRQVELAAKDLELAQKYTKLMAAKAHFDKAADLAKQAEELRQSAALKIQNGSAKVAAADKQIADADKQIAVGEAKRIEGARLMMVGALTRMVFAHFDSKNATNRQADVAKARQYCEGFSEQIVASFKSKQWTVAMANSAAKCPCLTKDVLQSLVKLLITDSRFPGLASPELDLGGFKDEMDIQSIVEFVISMPKLKSISFGDLSNDQLAALAKGFSSYTKASEPNFIKFTNSAITAKFTEELRLANSTSSSVPQAKSTNCGVTNGASSSTSRQVKALPAVPPNPGKNPVATTVPIDIVPVGSNAPTKVVTVRGSPPQAQA